MSPKRTYILVLILISSLVCHRAQAQGLVQTGGYIVFNNGPYLIIDGAQGNYYDTLVGRIQVENTGFMDVPGNWTNVSTTNVFNKNFGIVNLTGGIQNIQGNNSTSFPTLNLLGTDNKHLRVNALVGGGFGTGGTGVLACNNKLLFLNSRQLTINNQASSAITASTGGIVSETDATAGYGTVRWVCRDITGAYVVPFTAVSGQRIDYTLNINTAGVSAANNGYFSVSTYPTITSVNPNNRPLPTTVTNTLNEYGRENAPKLADRFYVIATGAYTTDPNAIPTFSYLLSEIDLSGGSTNTINASNLKPIRYNPAGNSWIYPGSGLSNPASRTVTGSMNNYRGIFTLADTTICPLALFTWSGNCENDPIQFTDNSIVNGSTLESHDWDFDDGFSANIPNPVHVFSPAGVYNVELIITALTGCKDTVVQAVTIDARAVADFIYDDEPLVGIPVQFTEITSNSNNFFWDFGDLNTSNAANPQHTFEDENFYDVMLIANNPANCPDTIIKQLEVLQPTLFLIPTGFSPGVRDNINSTFGLKTLQRISEYEMNIYTRWGEQIFTSDNIAKTWDGTYLGQEVMDGNYLYTITFRDRLKHIHYYKGMVTLLRN